MPKDLKEHLVDIHLAEFEKLKQEQIQRIGFRDNLIYANLIAITGVISVAAGDVEKPAVFLVLPLANLTLGWTYLVNDEKISAIGRYFRNDLTPRLQKLLPSIDNLLAGWEIVNRAADKRRVQKIIQFIIDVVVFTVPGWIAIALFWLKVPLQSWIHWASLGEALLLLALFVLFVIYEWPEIGKNNS
jgi:NADH:ubiquinone oxidoreductase subunit 3 (subunit A)